MAKLATSIIRVKAPRGQNQTDEIDKIFQAKEWFVKYLKEIYF